LLPPSSLTFSLLFCLLREKVDMERVGLEALAAAAVGAFSGEYVRARVAEGVLRCEDVLPVPADVLVRRDALRDRRKDEPMSVTDDAIECLLACLRFGGVVGTLGLVSYWLGSRGGSSGVVRLGAGARLRAGGEMALAAVWEMEREERAALACPLGPLEPKKEGRLEKKLGVACACALDSLTAWSAIVHMSTVRSQGGGSGALPISPLPAWRGGCTAMREGRAKGSIL
jgi:hypothetical protein